MRRYSQDYLSARLHSRANLRSAARSALVIDRSLEHRTYCKVAIIWDHPPLDASRVTCGQPRRNFAVQILRDGIRGCTDLRCSVQAFDEIGGEGSRRRLKSGAIRLQRHLPPEPLMVVFQTAKLRRGVQMFRPTRSNANGRQITTILQ